MVCPYKTIKKAYKNKKIYIWNVNRDSIALFMKAAFHGISIRGFVTFGEYAGESYMNRPVVDIHEMETGSVILAADNVLQDERNMLPDDGIISWSDVLEVNEELYEKKIIVYGTGMGAETLCEKLLEHGLEADLFCMTKREQITQFKGKPVIEAEDLHRYEDYAILISVRFMEYRMQILEILHGFQGCVYLNMEDMNLAVAGATNFIQNLDAAFREHKKIYLYGTKNAMAQWIEHVLSVYGIEIQGYVNEEADEQKCIESIYELSYEGMEDKFVIINEHIPERIIRSRELLEFAGFSLENRNYAGFLTYTAEKRRLLGELQFSPDPLTGVSIFYPKGKAGWSLYGKEEAGRVRILVGGGSTSSEEYHVENWAKKLYNNLNKAGVKTTIYNGAHPGDDILDEMLRLFRDGAAIRPHIVISMSGVNNLHRKKSVSQFNEERLFDGMKAVSDGREICSGLYCRESMYSFWARNIQLMKLTSEFYGASFFGVLQPMNMTMDQMTVWEKSLYEQEEHKEGAKEFAGNAESGRGYINMLRLFERQHEMFFDACHYTDKAHEILADKIQEIIMPAIQRLQRKG